MKKNLCGFSVDVQQLEGLNLVTPRFLAENMLNNFHYTADDGQDYKVEPMPYTTKLVRIETLPAYRIFMDEVGLNNGSVAISFRARLVGAKDVPEADKLLLLYQPFRQVAFVLHQDLVATTVLLDFMTKEDYDSARLMYFKRPESEKPKQSWLGKLFKRKTEEWVYKVTPEGLKLDVITQTQS